MIFNLPMISKFKPNIELSCFSGYIGYLILGCYLSIKEFSDTKWITKISITLIFSGIIITDFVTYLISSYKGKFYHEIYNYLTPNELLVSLGVFLLTKHSHFENKFLKIIRDFLCKYSYGIYLVHILVLTNLNKIGLNCYYIHPSFGIFLTTIICIIISSLYLLLINCHTENLFPDKIFLKFKNELSY